MPNFPQVFSNITYTENNMPTNISSLSPTLDLFYLAGNQDKIDKYELTKKALEENYDLTVKILGWSRSIRQGAGVRSNLRAALLAGLFSLERIDWSWFAKQGYWKDIFFFNPDLLPLSRILPLIAFGIKEGDNLLLKWLPRRKKRNKEHKNNKWIYAIKNYLDIDEREYRKICSSFVTTEALICTGRISEINYSHVASKSMQRHRKLFMKKDGIRYTEFLTTAAEGKDKKVKVNASAVYPHEIIRMILREAWAKSNVSMYLRRLPEVTPQDLVLAEAQWKNLPEKFSTDKKMLVVGDTSASMLADEALSISLALTIYCAERIKGAFHNFACTFSSHPSFIQFSDSDTLFDKIKKIPEIISDTNIEAVLDMVLRHASVNNVVPEDMPEVILIISDMQFNEGVEDRNQNISMMIDAKYTHYPEYSKPQVIYWNVRSSKGIPVKVNEKGVALFSGASPNSISQVLAGEFDPMKAMLRVVDKEEFNFLLRE